MRHGEAEPYSGIDATRNLTKHGREAASRAGDFFATGKHQISQVFCSDYHRAQQTAQLVCDKLPGLTPIIKSEIRPNAQAAQVSDFINLLEVPSVLLVSHQPFVSLFLYYCTGSKQYSFATADIAAVNFDHGAVAPGFGQLQFYEKSGD